MERMHFTAAMPLLAINTYVVETDQCLDLSVFFTETNQTVTFIHTFSMTRLPPNRVTNSAGDATVKSLWRSIFLCSRPFFTR